MRKDSLIILMAALFSTAIAAQTCPSLKDIHNNNLAGWKAYDIYGTRFSATQTDQFRKRALEFALAEVIPFSSGVMAIRCLYKDKNGSNLQGYLAKDNMVADNTRNYWYDVTGSKHCAAGVKLCQFVPNVLDNPQLAKK